MPIVQFVNYGDTIADVVRTEQTSASLTATTSILLAVLLVVSFLTNLLLVATILARFVRTERVALPIETPFSYKLRGCLLYLMLCQLSVMNVLDSILIMFVSLLYVSNGSWVFGDFVCRLNTWAQDFISLYSFFIITLMATERALGVTENGRHLISLRYVLLASVLFFTVALCFASPLFLANFSVTPYPHRYLCSIGGYEFSHCGCIECCCHLVRAHSYTLLCK